jgi:hypothetical protein
MNLIYDRVLWKSQPRIIIPQTKAYIRSFYTQFDMWNWWFWLFISNLRMDEEKKSGEERWFGCSQERIRTHWITSLLYDVLLQVSNYAENHDVDWKVSTLHWSIWFLYFAGTIQVREEIARFLQAGALTYLTKHQFSTEAFGQLDGDNVRIRKLPYLWFCAMVIS